MNKICTKTALSLAKMDGGSIVLFLCCWYFLSCMSILSACTTAPIVSTTLPIYFIVSIKLKEEDTSHRMRPNKNMPAQRPRQGKAKAAIRFFVYE